MTRDANYPPGWGERPFDEVIDFQEGPGILAKDFRPVGVPLIRLAGLEKGTSVLEGCNYLDPDMVEQRWSHFRVREGDILLSTSASLGRTAVVDAKSAGAISYTGIIRMRPRDTSLHAPFIRFLLESPHFQLQVEAMGAGSVLRHFGPSHLRQMTVVVPPEAEQRAIAHILGALDDKIELNRRMNETMEAMARAIFKSWFVDFDPVRGKAEGRKPLSMDAATAALFPDSFQDSIFGKIPRGWTIDKVGHAAEVTDYVANGSFAALKQNVRLYDEPEYALFVRTTDYRSGFKGQLKYTDHNSYKFLRKSCLNGDEVIISNVGDTGTVFRPPVWFRKPMTLGSNAIAIRGNLYGEFLYYYFLESQGQDAINSIVSGSAQPKFNKTDFRALPICMPPKDIAALFNKKVHVLWRRQVENNRENLILTALRDALLPKLLSGEIRVRDPERFVRDVL